MEWNAKNTSPRCMGWWVSLGNFWCEWDLGQGFVCSAHVNILCGVFKVGCQVAGELDVL
jgi:hypothetical protein